MKFKQIILFGTLICCIGIGIGMTGMASAAAKDEQRSTIGIYIVGSDSNSEADDSIPLSPSIYQNEMMDKRTYPQTRDSSSYIWISLLGFSLLIIVILLIRGRSKKNSGGKL